MGAGGGRVNSIVRTLDRTRGLQSVPFAEVQWGGALVRGAESMVEGAWVGKGLRHVVPSGVGGRETLAQATHSVGERE